MNEFNTEGEGLPDEITTAEEQPAVAEGNIFGRFADLIVKPSRLMDKVGQRPALWLALTAILLISGAITFILLPIQGPEMVQMVRDSSSMSGGDQAQQMEILEKMYNPSGVGGKALFAWGTSLTMLVASLLLGAIFHGSAKLSGGHGRFVQGLGITVWAGLLPLVVGPLLKTPLVLATGSALSTNLGLAALFPNLDYSSGLYKLLVQMGDFPSWWGLALVVIGFERVYKMSRSAAALTIILTWALLLVIINAPSLIMSMVA